MEPEGSLPYSQVPATCPYPAPAQSSPYHHNPRTEDSASNCPPIYIWVSLLVSFPQLPHQTPVHASPFLHKCHMPRLYHSSRFYNPHNIWWGVQILKLLVIQISPLLCYRIPLRPKYSPQHPILKHLQPTFLPQCQRPSFTHIQNNRQNYYVFWLQMIM